MKLIGLASGTEFTIPHFYFSPWGSPRFCGRTSFLPGSQASPCAAVGVVGPFGGLALTSCGSFAPPGQPWPLRPARPPRLPPPPVEAPRPAAPAKAPPTWRSSPQLQFWVPPLLPSEFSSRAQGALNTCSTPRPRLAPGFCCLPRRQVTLGALQGRSCHCLQLWGPQETTRVKRHTASWYHPVCPWG